VFKRFALLMTLVVALAGITALAGDKMDDKMMDKGDKGMMDGKEMTFSGKLVCLACSLKSEGAHAACKEFGHTHSLMTSDGKYISFLQNDHSKDLFEGTKGDNKMVTVTGHYFANANMLDVTSFTIENGKKMSWCDHHMKMDACSAM